MLLSQKGHLERLTAASAQIVENSQDSWEGCLPIQFHSCILPGGGQRSSGCSSLFLEGILRRKSTGGGCPLSNDSHELALTLKWYMKMPWHDFVLSDLVFYNEGHVWSLTVP